MRNPHMLLAVLHAQYTFFKCQKRDRKGGKIMLTGGRVVASCSLQCAVFMVFVEASPKMAHPPVL